MHGYARAPQIIVSTESINDHLERIAELKEALKHVRNLSEEMQLLATLSSEISVLRELLACLPPNGLPG